MQQEDNGDGTALSQCAGATDSIAPLAMCVSKTLGCLLFQDGVQAQDLPVWFKHAAVAGPAAPAAPADPAELARLRLQPARRPQLTAPTGSWRREAAGGPNLAGTTRLWAEAARPTGPRAPGSGGIGGSGRALVQEAVIAPLLDGCRRQQVSMSDPEEASLGMTCCAFSAPGLLGVPRVPLRRCSMAAKAVYIVSSALQARPAWA